MKETLRSYLSILGVITLGLGLILFTQSIKLIKDPASTPITYQTFIGLLVLGTFAFIGIVVSNLMKKTGIKILANFPVLGWVSLVSLFFCLLSNFFVQAIGGVDFLSITTPVLAFAGVSVANSLKDLTKDSWKFVIIALFIFFGSYLFRVIIAQVGLILLE